MRAVNGIRKCSATVLASELSSMEASAKPRFIASTFFAPLRLAATASADESLPPLKKSAAFEPFGQALFMLALRSSSYRERYSSGPAAACALRASRRGLRVTFVPSYMTASPGSTASTSLYIVPGAGI